ncbi:outer membrane beta-barrel protein [Enterobacter hormaechei]|nr:outer membrane beta-barrel protein [Enterobacter hormaechei]
MKHINISLVAASLVLAGSALAGEHTITGGWAHTEVSATPKGDSLLDGKMTDKLDGLNVKYGYQFTDSALGIQTSLTATTKDEGDYTLGYATLAAGPSYNITDDLKIYALVGSAGAEVKSHNYTERQHGVMGSAGFQYNIAGGFTVDASYEYVKFDFEGADVKTNTFVIGAGYKF